MTQAIVSTITQTDWRMLQQNNDITDYFWKVLIIISDVRLGAYFSNICVAVTHNDDEVEYRQKLSERKAAPQT